MSKAQKARDIVERFPHLSKKKLGELLFKENNLLFKDSEDARRYVRAVTGSKNGESVIKTDKYIGVLPEGEKNDFSPFVLKGERIGVLSDIHIPYHDTKSLNMALEFLKKEGVDTILLNGDTIDAYNLSDYQKDPNVRNHAYEMELLTIFLDDLKANFPKAEIVLKLGNHCARYEKFIYQKSPEFVGMHVMSWKHLINIRFEKCKTCEGIGVHNGIECPNCENGTVANNVSRGIHLVKNKRIVKAGKLNIIHGNEFNGTSSPVNAARAYSVKAKTNVMAGHLHQVSYHPEVTLNGETYGSWSVGCLCDLHPEYAPYNKWQHGFAIVEVEDNGEFDVRNYQIINGKIR